MKRSLLISALMAAAFPFRMAEDAPAADVETPAQAAPEVEPPATVTVEVPAEHVNLLQRAVELLKSGEQWIKDNIEAGVTTLEGLFKSDDKSE